MGGPVGVGTYNRRRRPNCILHYLLRTSTYSVSAEKFQHAARSVGNTVGIFGNEDRRKYPVSVPNYRMGLPGVGLFVVLGLGSTSWWDERTGVGPVQPLTLTPSQAPKRASMGEKRGLRHFLIRGKKKKKRKFYHSELQTVTAVCRKKISLADLYY